MAQSNPLLDYIRKLTDTGFYNINEVTNKTWQDLKFGSFPDLPKKPDRKEIRQIAKDEKARKSTEEKEWPKETDCDRLTKSFRELTLRGVISLENAGYTKSEGWEEFHEALSMWRIAGKGDYVRGGCFYHEQDLLSALDRNEICIAFGATSGEDSDGISIAEEIIEILQNHGFSPSWNKSVDTRIIVPIEWKRRYGPGADTIPPPPEGLKPLALDKKSRDKQYLESLGEEDSSKTCQAEKCDRGTVDYSVFCKKHHFKMIKGRK